MTIMMGQEFDKIMENMPAVDINTAVARQHVGEIERGIRFFK